MSGDLFVIYIAIVVGFMLVLIRLGTINNYLKEIHKELRKDGE